jgi:hypothetical protein
VAKFTNTAQQEVAFQACMVTGQGHQEISITEVRNIQMEELGTRQRTDYQCLKTGQTSTNYDYMTLNPHFGTTQMCVN